MFITLISQVSCKIVLFCHNQFFSLLHSHYYVDNVFIEDEKKWSSSATIGFRQQGHALRTMQLLLETQYQGA